MNKNLSRKLRLLVKLSDELKEANQEGNQEGYQEEIIDIVIDILRVVSSLKRFEQDFAVQPKSKLSSFLLGEANDRIIRFKSGDMGIGLLQEVEQSYLLWAKGNICPMREALYPNFPTAFFQYVCEEMNW